MFFRLIMPSVDRQMKSGVVSKWHKMEGDPVDYGEPLVDVKVEYAMRAPHRSLDQKIRLILDGKSLQTDEGADAMADTAMTLVARITSSDAGVLRKIEAGEDTRVEAGSLLAVLSTEDHVTADLPTRGLNEASEFRVVANLVE